MQRLLLLYLFLAGCTKSDDKPTDSIPVSAEDADKDGFDAETDCDDGDPQIHPDAPEVCDGLDNDCDGTPDEGLGITWYSDADQDGWGDDAAAVTDCAQPPGAVATGGDCDDTNAAAFPDNPEVCDGADNDCDGESDEGVQTPWYADVDADGYGDPAAETLACAAPEGYVTDATDCDDTDASAFPGNPEVCDEVDNDCDGTTDEDVTTSYWIDLDSDQHGDLSSAVEACDRPTGYADTPTDCDDLRAESNPDAPELCDGLDNDCDGDIDEEALDALTWYLDADQDGFGDQPVVACDAPSGAVSVGGDCDDSAASTNPDADELCGGGDEDCDGSVDESTAADAPTWYGDGDGDGYGGSTFTTISCAAPANYVATNDDCDDGDRDSHPGADEVCGGGDEDCDNAVDEQDAIDAASWYIDGDNDGYGATEILACTAPSGAVSDGGDCDDGDPSAYPGGQEVCGGGDEDCDLAVDEPDEVYGEAAGCAALHCDDLLSARAAPDGLYWIDPNGLGAYVVSCDMTSSGGGWTQVISASYAEIAGGDPPDFDYDESVWTGAGYGSAGDATHISPAWADTPAYSELMFIEGSAVTTESVSLSGDLADQSKTSGSIKINALFSSSYGPWGGRLYTSTAYAICNTGNGSTSWGRGLGAVRSCEHSYGTLYYEWSNYGSSATLIELWIR